MIKKALFFLSSFITFIIYSFLLVGNVKSASCESSNVRYVSTQNQQTGKTGIQVSIGQDSFCIYNIEIYDPANKIVKSVVLSDEKSVEFVPTEYGQHSVVTRVLRLPDNNSEAGPVELENTSGTVVVTESNNSIIEQSNNNQNINTQPAPTPNLQGDTTGRDNIKFSAVSTKLNNGIGGLDYAVILPPNANPSYSYRVMVYRPDGTPIGVYQDFTKDQIQNIPFNQDGTRLLTGSIQLADGTYKIGVIRTARDSFDVPFGNENVISHTQSANYIVNKENPQNPQSPQNPQQNGGVVGTLIEWLQGNGWYDGDTEGLVGQIVQAVYLFIFPIAVVIAVVKLLINIIQLAASKGDPNALSQAKEEITATLLGLLLIGGAVTIINILGSTLGV